jgi:hypothetical protein
MARKFKMKKLSKYCYDNGKLYREDERKVLAENGKPSKSENDAHLLADIIEHERQGIAHLPECVRCKAHLAGKWLDGAMISASDIAACMGIPERKHAIEVYLGRLRSLADRQRNSKRRRKREAMLLPDWAYHEAADPPRQRPRYYYAFRVVFPLLRNRFV